MATAMLALPLPIVLLERRLVRDPIPELPVFSVTKDSLSTPDRAWHVLLALPDKLSPLPALELRILTFVFAVVIRAKILFTA